MHPVYAISHAGHKRGVQSAWKISAPQHRCRVPVGPFLAHHMHRRMYYLSRRWPVISWSMCEAASAPLPPRPVVVLHFSFRLQAHCPCWNQSIFISHRSTCIGTCMNVGGVPQYMLFVACLSRPPFESHKDPTAQHLQLEISP